MSGLFGWRRTPITRSTCLSAEDPTAACSSVLLRMTVEPASQPSLTQPLLAYALSLECRDSDGHRAAQRQELYAPEQGEVKFFFRPCLWQTTGRLVERSEGRSTVDLSVTGSIHVDVQPDGSLRVSVYARRVASWGGGLVWGEGTAQYTALPDESITLPLPQPRGAVEAVRDVTSEPAGAKADGVSVSGDKIRIDFSRFFAERGCSLNVRVERDPG